jgi:hypothetical protein
LIIFNAICRLRRYAAVARGCLPNLTFWARGGWAATVAHDASDKFQISNIILENELKNINKKFAGCRRPVQRSAALLILGRRSKTMFSMPQIQAQQNDGPTPTNLLYSTYLDLISV